MGQSMVIAAAPVGIRILRKLVEFPKICAESGLSEGEIIRSFVVDHGGVFPRFSEILDDVRQDENIVESWLAYSADQRSTPNWYFERRQKKHYIGFQGKVNEGFGIFDDAAFACAAFIVLSMEDKFGQA